MAASVASDWLTAVSGNWTTASNWSTAPYFPNNGSPTAADQYNVLIDEAEAPYTVTLSSSVVVSSVTLDSPNATLSIHGSLSANALDVPRGAVIIGNTSNGSFALDIFDDITLNNTSIRLISKEDLAYYSFIRFLVTALPQAIRGQGTITFAQGRVNTIYPGLMKVSLQLCLAGTALLTIAAGSAHATPSRGSNCTGCHARADGNLDILPNNLFEAVAGGTAKITFDATALGSNGANALIAVFNLNNPALAATPELTGWMAQSDAGQVPPVEFITSDLFSVPRSFMLNIGIGAGATRGDYGITAILAGGRGTSTRWSTTRDLTLRIVPEPAAAALLCCGLAATALYARRRRFGTAKT